jgi:hypothetical protein
MSILFYTFTYVHVYIFIAMYRYFFCILHRPIVVTSLIDILFLTWSIFLKQAPRWNFHCSLSTLGKLLGILNEDQKREFVHAAGFQSLLEINLNKDIPPSFL